MPKTIMAEITSARRRWSASRGGHAPGVLRETFCDYVKALLDADAMETLPTCTYNGEEKPFPWLRGQLWNCTDILPSALYSDLLNVVDNEQLSRCRTYGKAVRLMSPGD